MIFTLLKKELKALFCHPFSLSLISVLNIVPAVILAVNLALSQSQKLYSGFESIISIMSLVLAVAIPAVAASSISAEKKRGTIDFLCSTSASRASVITSKFLALTVFFAIPCAIMAFFPFVLSGFGTVNYLHCYASLGMLIVFEAFIVSLSLMLSALASSTVVATVISYAILAVSFLFGILSPLVRFLPLGTSFDKIAEGFLAELSFFKKFDYVIFELFDWTSLLFFLAGIAAFTFIGVAAYRKGKPSKKVGGRKTAMLTVSLLLVVCLAFFPMLLPLKARQLDLNKNKLYTPSSSVSDFLSSADEEITVYLIDPYTNEEELYNAIVRTVESGKNMKLEIVNSSEDKAFLEKYGLEDSSQQALSYAMVIESSKRWQFINGESYFSYYNKSMGYLTSSEFEYRYTYCLSLLDQYYSYYDSLSADMQDALTRCYQIVESLQNETLVCLQVEDAIAEAVAYVSADIIPTVYFLSGHGEEGTTINPYDFKKNGSLPKNADVAVINSPSEDYSESEISTLTDYVERGGKLYILLDKENNSMPNLSRLLAYYGLTVEDSVISVEDNTIVDVSVNKSHEALANMSASRVTVKDVSKISFDSENSKYTYTPMLSYKTVEGDAENEYPVALSVSEGSEKRVTVFTGAITFNSLDSGINEEALERVSPCVSNTMSWMFESFDSGLSQTPPKLYQKGLYVADSGDITKIVVFFAVLVPLGITLITVTYIASRHLRSKRAVSAREDD